MASGVEPGDRVAIWAFNSAEWIVAVLGVFEAGAVLVPINTRFKGAEAATSCVRSRARVLVTVTDFLGTDYVAMLDGHRRRAAGPRHHRRRPRRRRPGGTESWETFLARATEAAAPRWSGGGMARRPRRPVRHPVHLGHHRGPQGRGADPRPHAAGGHRLGGDDRARAPDDRYLMVNPYFHMFGLKAGILASVAAGATMLPEAVFDVDRVLARVAEEAVTVLPGPADAVPGDPRPSRPRPPRPVEPAGGGDRRGRHPGRADPPDRRGAAVLRRSSPATG